MSKVDYVCAAAVAAVVFYVYRPTITKGIPGGDSGELVAEACTLGVAHPPGYPLFVYAARAAIEVLGRVYGDAAGTPAFRVNSASAWLGSVTAGILCLAFSLIIRATRHALVHSSRGLEPSTEESVVFAALSACAAAAWAFSPLIWLYAVGAEVFSLNNAACALLLWRWAAFMVEVETEGMQVVQAQGASDKEAAAFLAMSRFARKAAALSFLCGLALCNQHTSLLLVLPIAASTALVLAPSLTVASTCGIIAAGLAGLSPYLHLPIAHTRWRGAGSWGDASTLHGFMRHFLRSDYGTFRLLAQDKGTEPSEGPLERTVAYIQDLGLRQLPHPSFLLLALCGGCIGVSAGMLGLIRARRSIIFPQVWQRTKPLHATGRVRGGTGIRVADGAEESPPHHWAASLAHACAVASAAPAGLPIFLVSYLAVFHSLANMPLQDPLLAGIHARFWLQPNALVFGCLAVGLSVPILLLSVGVGQRIGAGTPTAAATGGSLGQAVSVRYTVTGLAVAVAAWMVQAQQARNVSRSDASRNDVFDRYGRALLLPLPPKAILVTSFDFQWTAARYLQTCEAVRTDVSLLNAPVMSYDWWAAQRHLYPRVAWPGTHLTPHMTAPHAAGPGGPAKKKFAPVYRDDLLLNFPGEFPLRAGEKSTGSRHLSRTACVDRHGGIFFAGPFSHAHDSAHYAQMEVLPHGPVNRVVWRREGAAGQISSWRNVTASASDARMPHVTGARVAVSVDDIVRAESAWRTAVLHFDGVSAVPVHEYDDGTWERASRIEFWGSAIAYGTWWLEWALDSDVHVPVRASWVQAGHAMALPSGTEAVNVTAALAAASLLEEAAWQQAAMGVPVTASTWKNLGLAYVRLVRWPLRLTPDVPAVPLLPWMPPFPPLPKRRRRARKGEGEGVYAAVLEDEWRGLAAERVLETWGDYLSSPESESDESRATIAGVVQTLSKASAGAKAKASAKTPARPRSPGVKDAEGSQPSGRTQTGHASIEGRGGAPRTGRISSRREQEQEEEEEA